MTGTPASLDPSNLSVEELAAESLDSPLDDQASTRSFEQRVSPVMPDLLRYFARRVRPEEDAYDCLSETLIVLWKKENKLPAIDDELRAWSFGIARKVLSNHLRGQSRRAALSDRAARHASEPEAVPEFPEVLDAMATLPRRDQELLRLIVWDGFGVAEAGALLGIKPASARTRFARAKTRLKKQLST